MRLNGPIRTIAAPRKWFCIDMADALDGPEPSPIETGKLRATLERAKESERTLTRQGRRTRNQLIRGARKVFEEKGYHHTRIADITTAADTAIGSFYTYFESKEEVFRVLLIELENEVYEEPTRLPRDAVPQERLRETNRLFFQSFRRNAPFWAVVEEAAMTDGEARQVLSGRHRQSRARTEAALRTWQEAGLIPIDVDVAFFATALGAMTERCAFLWFVLGEPIDFEEAVDRITEIWVQALQLAPPPADPARGA